MLGMDLDESITEALENIINHRGSDSSLDLKEIRTANFEEIDGLITKLITEKEAESPQPEADVSVKLEKPTFKDYFEDNKVKIEAYRKQQTERPVISSIKKVKTLNKTRLRPPN